MTKELQGKLEWMHREHVRFEENDRKEELEALEAAFKDWKNVEKHGWPSIDDLLNLQDMELEGIGFTPVTSSEPF